MMINRVSMEALGDQLSAFQKGVTGLPNQISQAVGNAVSSPIQAIQSVRPALRV